MRVCACALARSGSFAGSARESQMCARMREMMEVRAVYIHCLYVCVGYSVDCDYDY